MENATTEIKVNCLFLLVLCFTKLLNFSLQVNVPLNEIEFLNLDDVDSKQERAFLLGCVQSKEGKISFKRFRLCSLSFI